MYFDQQVFSADQITTVSLPILWFIVSQILCFAWHAHTDVSPDSFTKPSSLSPGRIQNNIVAAAVEKYWQAFWKQQDFSLQFLTLKNLHDWFRDGK